LSYSKYLPFRVAKTYSSFFSPPPPKCSLLSRDLYPTAYPRPGAGSLPPYKSAPGTLQRGTRPSGFGGGKPKSRITPTNLPYTHPAISQPTYPIPQVTYPIPALPTPNRPTLYPPRASRLQSHQVSSHTSNPRRPTLDRRRPRRLPSDCRVCILPSPPDRPTLYRGRLVPETRAETQSPVRLASAFR
jgi:hypothetical protein